MNGLTINTRNFPPPGQLSGSQCSICFENFDSNKRSVTTTECHHTFHSDCLSGWLTHKPSCPLCRKMLSDRSVSGASQNQAAMSEAPICAICRDCLNEPVSITRCLHRFHSRCLSRWSREKSDPFCPLCRSPLSESRAPAIRVPALRMSAIRVPARLVPESRILPQPLLLRRFHQITSECPICLEPIRGENVITTPCNHDFHSECFSSWLMNRRGASCPSCRVLLPPQRVALRNNSGNVDAWDLLATPLLADEGADLRNTYCHICQSPYEGAESLFRAVCGHDFHMRCLELSIRNPSGRSCPHCSTPLVVPTRSPAARDSMNGSLGATVSILRRELSDSVSPPEGDTNAAGMGFVAIDIPESDDNEWDSDGGLPNRFPRRAVRRTGMLASYCHIC